MPLTHWARDRWWHSFESRTYYAYPLCGVGQLGFIGTADVSTQPSVAVTGLIPELLVRRAPLFDSE